MGFGEVPAHGRLALAATALALAIGWADVAAQAQEAPPAEAATEQPPTTAEQPVTAAEQPATAEVPAQTDLLAPEQLDILVSPVALYPDPLLVLVLQGSTFPVEVIAANRFLGKLAEQPELQPDPDWDTSIVGLLNYPDVLARMDAELDWTEALGEAVLNQLEDVQASIQQVRLQAYMAGMLATNEQQVVTGSPTLIIVLPADQTQIFVPNYDPAAVLAAEPVPLAPVEAAAEAPAEPEIAEEPAPAEPEVGRSCRRGARRACAGDLCGTGDLWGTGRGAGELSRAGAAAAGLCFGAAGRAVLRPEPFLLDRRGDFCRRGGDRRHARLCHRRRRRRWQRLGLQRRGLGRHRG